MSLTLPEATSELSAPAISLLFRELFEEADRAFRTDPGFVVAIAEASAEPEMREAAQRMRGLREAERLRRETALTNAEIAERVGITVWFVNRHLARHMPCTPEMRSRINQRRAGTQPRAQQDPNHERNQRVMGLRRQGFTVTEIAEQVSLSVNGVQYLLKRHGDPLPDRARSRKRAARDELVRQLAAGGMFGKDIAQELGLSAGTVSRIINAGQRT